MEIGTGLYTDGQAAPAHPNGLQILQKNATTGLFEAIATDNPMATSEQTASAGTKSNVAANASSVTLLAANASRKMASIYNDSSAILYLDMSGGTASATSFTTKLQAETLYEFPLPVYVGAVTGIWASATGAARITEWT